MAILLSVRAESDLLCLLQSHPLQPAAGHVGQGLQHHFQSLQYLLMYIHGHRSSEHRELSLAMQRPIQITAFHSPIDLRVSQCRTRGFICTLAGCKLSHSIEFYMGFALHPQRLSPPSHINQRNYCCNIASPEEGHEDDQRAGAPLL